MRVSVSHKFTCTPDALWDVFDSEEFEAEFAKATDVIREISEERRDGAVSYRRRECTLASDLPALAKKVMGGSALAWHEEATLDRDRNRLEWEVILPGAIGDRVKVKGSTRIRFADGVCTRSISGDISVRVPLIGGRVESLIAKSVGESYDKASAIALKILHGQQDNT
ncbi:MAG: hypothetical protein ACI81R_000567 [Bradymonadia bacterium]|jgi:hypothetical protein